MSQFPKEVARCLAALFRHSRRTLPAAFGVTIFPGDALHFSACSDNCAREMSENLRVRSSFLFSLVECPKDGFDGFCRRTVGESGMIIGLALIANVSAALSGLLAYILGADNILLIMLLAGYGAPILIVAGMVLKTLTGLASPRIAPTADDAAARP
jgi:hypothetical protein